MPENSLAVGTLREHPRKKLRIGRFSGRSTERPYCLMDSGKFDTPSSGENI